MYANSRSSRNSGRGDSRRERLRRAGIRHYDKLIHDQPKDWLVNNFKKGADEYPVNVARLMRNLVWQMKERIQSGEKKFEELVRTYWYMYVKSTLARADALSEDADQYKQLTYEITRMVKYHKLMRYKDIGFRDENEAHRSVGVFANILPFAEKVGQHPYLAKLHDKHGVSIIALGGQPSVMNVEYFVDEIKKRINIRRSFYLYAIVDYDPSGWLIRDAFLDDLRHYGIKHLRVHDLINPDVLKPEEILMSRYPVEAGPDMQEKNREWLQQVTEKHYKNQKYLVERRGGKLKLYGLEAESVSSARLTGELEELMVPVIGKDELRLKIREMGRLDEAVRDLIFFKVTHPEVP